MFFELAVVTQWLVASARMSCGEGRYRWMKNVEKKLVEQGLQTCGASTGNHIWPTSSETVVNAICTCRSSNAMIHMHGFCYSYANHLIVMQQ